MSDSLSSADRDARIAATRAAMRKAVEKFNALYPPRSQVTYRSHAYARPVQAEVTGAAFILSGHTACAWISCSGSCVALDALSAPIHDEDFAG